MKKLLIFLFTVATLSAFAADSKDKMKIGDKSTHRLLNAPEKEFLIYLKN